MSSSVDFQSFLPAKSFLISVCFTAYFHTAARLGEWLAGNLMVVKNMLFVFHIPP